MCNIAGYVGQRRAAPILIEMMRRQEGMEGGYYTGIATLHEGRIYHAKLTGDLDRLLRETQAADLPGNIGILHSRSNSGGGDEWAHPFVGKIGGIPQIAYVANGTVGIFKDRLTEADRLADELQRQGYSFARLPEAKARYIRLPDGAVVHMSDVMCQLILRNLRRCGNEEQAMSDAFCEMPAEIVGLLLSLNAPKHIIYSRINFPMMVGFAPHGAYLGTAAMAFPKDASDVAALPPLSAGWVSAREVHVTPMSAPPTTVPRISEAHLANAVALLRDELTGRDMTYKELRRKIAALLGEGCQQVNLLGYEALRLLQNEGSLSMRTERVAGAADGITAPKFVFTLKG